MQNKVVLLTHWLSTKVSNNNFYLDNIFSTFLFPAWKRNGNLSLIDRELDRDQAGLSTECAEIRGATRAVVVYVE